MIKSFTRQINESPIESNDFADAFNCLEGGGPSDRVT